MTEHKREDLRRVFDLAIAAAPGDRGPLLDRECGGDSGLKKRVEAMVAAAEDERFLSEPSRGSAADAPTVAATSAAAPTVVAPLREGPGTRIGPYKLLQQIGEGGFGSVFMAEQEKPVARKVALKIIKLGMDTRQVVARFEQERQALAMMDHPNIARVLDAGATETGRPFFVMELVKGDPIVEYADKNSLSIDRRLELFAQVCTAVQHAHTKGIIHRDIKPSNILVSTHDGKPHAKVIDFGIAKATSSKLTEMTLFTEHRQMIGTPQYMSPEQAEGNLDIDTRTDVYSLGVLLYELLTGTTPFTSQELRSAAYAEFQRIIREVEPPKPSTRLSSNTETIASVASRRQIEPKRLGALVRGELDWIVMKALEKDRQRRYETPSAFADDVRRYLSGDAVVAAPPSAAYRFKKFVRRNKGPVLAGCAVAAALVFGMIGTAWQARVAGEQRDLAVLAQRAEAQQRKQADTARAEAEQQRARADERAIAAEKAEREEKERADQLKQVSEFHSQMLSKIDTTAAGVDLMKDIRERFVATLKKASVPEAELAAQSEMFGTLLVRVNATDTAAALIDRTILKPAIKTIDERFQNDPATDASLREALGELYQSIGLLSAAFPLHESALATRRRALGDEHPDTLDSMNDVGVSLRVQGKLSEATPFIRDALAARRRVLGEEHADTLESVNSMAMLLQAQGKLADAEPYYRESLEKCRRVLGDEHENTLFAISNLGTQLWAAGKLAEAEPYLRDALEKRRRVLGEENPNTLVSINNMANLLETQGKLDEAEPYYREVLEARRRVMGEEHPHTLNSIRNLGNLLRARGKYAEAEPYLRESLEKHRRLLGDEHPKTLIAINVLAYLLQSQGRFAETEPYRREVLEKSRRVLGEEHPDTIIALSNMGMLMKNQGNLPEAELLLREVVEKFSRVVGKEHPNTLGSSTNLAGVFRERGKHQEAIDLLGPAEPAARKVFTGGNATKLAAWLTALGRARVSLGYDPERFALADANLLEAHSIYAAAKDQTPMLKDMLGCIQGLIDLYTAWNTAEPDKGYGAKVAEWTTKLEAARAAEPKPDAKVGG